jgi:hypothetical protein
MFARRQLSIARPRQGIMTKPDPSLLTDVVAPRVIEAMEKASAALVQAGVRYAVAGALAVGANGHPRATKAADFLVGGEAFEHHAGGLVTLRSGIPFQVNGVAIDLLSSRRRVPAGGARRLFSRSTAARVFEAEVAAPSGSGRHRRAGQGELGRHGVPPISPGKRAGSCDAIR